jgi:hypothetical protein
MRKLSARLYYVNSYSFETVSESGPLKTAIIAGTCIIPGKGRDPPALPERY